MKFSSSVIRELKYYVYIYLHPITNQIFYVGKGKGNRLFSHLMDTADSEKVEYIQNLAKQNLSPKIEILVHGIEDKVTVLRIESAIIDLLGIKNLSNKQSGYKSATYGRMSIDQIVSVYGQKEANISEPSILIRINQAFRYSMSEAELYDYTRGHWKLNLERAKKARYAFSIYSGVIQEIYTVLGWFEALETFSIRKQNELIKRGSDERVNGRYEFIGDIAPDTIRKKYRHKSVNHYFNAGNMNPILYLNVE